MAIEPAWIDYNGHLNFAYYLVLFDRTIDAGLIGVGLGPDYVRERNASYFTVELHTHYLRELAPDHPVTGTLQLLDYDARRIHVYLELRHAGEGWVAAACEQLFLHVDMEKKRASAFPDDVMARLEAMMAAHRALPVDPKVGHVIGIPKKPRPTG
ncbi:MAG: thioesterase family protein [Hyphomicrobiales bacterium]